MESLCTANSTFAVDLLRKLCEKKSGQNVFFSPFSISSALSMVLLGSRGSTEAQMLKVLSLKNAQEAHNGYQSLLSEINDPNTKYILRSANRLYGERTFEFLPSFIESSQKSYHAGLEQMDFLHAWEDSRKQINVWVEERTEGKIQNLLAEGTLNSLTMLVLVNAIYFKGNLEKPFRKASTRERPFQINKLERELTYEKLMDWISPKMMRSTKVRLSLPRFKMEENYNLKPILSSMGMPDAFVLGKADFSGISSGNQLMLSEVIHKSFVEVNEEGIEAAAASAAVFLCAMIVPEFTADHPFLFFIRHNKTSSILFCGRFCCP
ncbi:serpin B6-like isoform X2 [Haemorhous mexicanus]|uniref:serpin B6-like isoform X2 n=1 Tax=Haemorhous mexicanus TaxID=30427 RepID=UPI0028BF1E54|nr:serpin B6-like isoform X2 [Haemorhous mexicanus]